MTYLHYLHEKANHRFKFARHVYCAGGGSLGTSSFNCILLYLQFKDTASFISMLEAQDQSYLVILQDA